MKVFLSSVISGYEGFRTAAARAVVSLGHEPKIAEDYAASVESPQVVCLRGVRDADAVLLLLGARYGPVQPSGRSATHEEYLEAREEGKVLAFVEEVSEREPAQEQLVKEVRAWNAQLTSSYKTTDELLSAVVRGLHEFELSRAGGRVDEGKLLGIAEAAIPKPPGAHTSLTVHVIVAGGPTQEILRPAELEAARLAEDLLKMALFGNHRVLDAADGTKRDVRRGALVLQQSANVISVDGAGTLVITQALPEARFGAMRGLGMVVQEDLQDAIAGALGYAAEVLEHIDPHRRLSDVVAVAALTGSLTLGMKSRAEVAASSGGSVSITPRVGEGPIVVKLTPPGRHRLALTNEATRLAEDLTVLIRRELTTQRF